MHIKQIRIAGFKSYRSHEDLAEPFSPHHNVIVGRNGAGKSNFFWAIRFVLLDAYSNPTNEERISLLHDASNSGPTAPPAYVEIVFDNTGDVSFPTGRNETTIRRVIAATKDEYILDKKLATKNEILSLLQAAGFTTANPYYIVPQGRVTALCNFRDADRLLLLKEISGITQYEGTRQTAMRKMDEISAKRTNIANAMTQITSRLESLESEKTLFATFTELEHERKCLEFALHDRELNVAKIELENADAIRAQATSNTTEILDSLSETRSRLAECTESISTLDSKLKIEFKATFDDCQRELARLSESRVSLLLSLRELGVDAEKSLNKRLNSNAAANAEATANKLREIDASLVKVRESIAMIEPRIAELKPRCSRLAESEKSLSVTLAAAEARLTHVVGNSAGGISDNHCAGAAFIAVEKAKIEEIFRDLLTAKEDLLSQIKEAALKLKDLEEKVTLAQISARNESAELQLAKEQKHDSEKLRNTLAEERKEQWRLQAVTDGKLSAANDNILRLERIVFAGMDRTVARGLQSLQVVVARLGITGVYGPLFELINVDAVFRTSVEVVAGNSLFSVLVADDDVATRVLDAMRDYKAELQANKGINSEQKEPFQDGVGRITLIPLNRISKTIGKSRVPENDTNVIPMLSRIQYDERFEPAMKQIFGNAAICSDLKVASRVSRDFDITTVTLQGDRIDRRGALTGGYIASRHGKREASLAAVNSTSGDMHRIATGGRLECIIAYRATLENREQLKLTAVQTKTKIAELDHKITIELSKIQKAREILRRFVPASDNQVPTRLENQTEYHALRKRYEAAQGEHLALMTRLENIEKDLARYQEQLKSFSSDTENELIGALASATLNASKMSKKANVLESREDIANLITTTRSQLKDVQRRRSEAESELNECETKLNKIFIAQELDFLRQKLELEVTCTSSAIPSDKNNDLGATSWADELLQEIAVNSAQKTKIESEMHNIESEMEAIREKLAALQIEKEQAHLKIQNLNNLIQNEERDEQNFNQRRQLLKEKIEAAKEHILELGTLPDDFAKYVKTETKLIEKKLLRVRGELQEYDGRVNKSAFEQCTTFTREREKLEEKCANLSEEDVAIRGLIEKLDKSKLDVLEKTFQTISKNFSDIWERLVPEGKGNLHLLSKSSDKINGGGVQRDNDNDLSSSSDYESDSDSEYPKGRTRARRKTSKKRKGYKKDGDDSLKTGIECYEGVSIKVSFVKNGPRSAAKNSARKNAQQELELSQLSGGQKSLVALCLIFAIQLCTPAPFYLFDEIDANLDAQYRTSVAQLVYELSRKAQFITTTFRTELLAQADAYYGVTFSGKSSKIQPVQKDEAMEFIEQAHDETQNDAPN